MNVFVFQSLSKLTYLCFLLKIQNAWFNFQNSVYLKCRLFEHERTISVLYFRLFSVCPSFCLYICILVVIIFNCCLIFSPVCFFSECHLLRFYEQLSLLSYEPFMTVGAKYLAHHVPHLHGHNFAVMAVGYPPYNETTGQWLNMNPSITCDAETSWRCENPYWTGDLPPLNTVNPPIKDTVVIPARG